MANNYERALELKNKVDELEEDVIELFETLLYDDEDVKDKWRYLQERRGNHAFELKEHFEGLKGDLNLIVNRDGLKIDITKEIQDKGVLD